MLHLRLCKALSYSGVVSATKAAPDVFVEDEATALAAVSTGYFKLVEGEAVTPPPAAPTGTITKLDAMTVPELKEYAKANNIDLTGASKKEEILARIEEASGTDEDPASQFTGGGEDENGKASE